MAMAIETKSAGGGEAERSLFRGWIPMRGAVAREIWGVRWPLSGGEGWI